MSISSGRGLIVIIFMGHIYAEKGTRCSSVVRAFALGAMGRRTH